MTLNRDPLIPRDKLVFCPRCKLYVGVYRMDKDEPHEEKMSCKQCRRVIVNKFDCAGWVIQEATNAAMD